MSKSNIRKVKAPSGKVVKVDCSNSDIEDIIDVYEYIMSKKATMHNDMDLGGAVRRVLNGDIK